MTCRFSPDAAKREQTPVDNSFIADFLPAAGALELKAYLYGLMQCCHPGMDGSMADALGVTQEALTGAFSYWQSQGLVRIVSEKPLTVEYLSVQESGLDTAIPTKYGSLVARLNSLTAPRQFGMRELKHVYDWIEVYGLEEGAVLELVGYCMEQKGRRVSINYMSAVAESWAEEGVRTFEAARAAIENYSLRRHGATVILRQWNKKRRPTQAEMALYDKWTTEWGFTEDAILAALPRLTVSASPNFTYLDELLDSLREKRLTGAEDIATDDAKTAQERAFAKLLFERAGKVEPATQTQRAQIDLYLSEYGMPRELLLYAADLSRGANEPFGRMKLLLNDWHGKGIRTVAEAEACQSEREKQARSAGRTYRGAKKDYAMHTISDEDFERLFLDLNQDIGEE